LSATITSGRVRGELLLAVSRAADQLRPDRPDEGVQLLDRGLAELRRRVADEVLPELPGVLALRTRSGRRRQVDQGFGEAERFQTPLPGRLRREYDPVAPAAQHISDPDTVVGRPVCALGHEQDGQHTANYTRMNRT
jgi:hypothetical protein